MSENERKRDVVWAMNQLQEEYKLFAEELKQIEAEERRAVNLERFKTLKFKVHVDVDYKLNAEHQADHLYDVTDEDRVNAKQGRRFVSIPNGDGSSFILFSTLEEWPRIKLTFNRLYAAKCILSLSKDKDVNVDECLKTLLGE